ncbi:MAG: PEP-CTERM sorting domain-containing protein [Burkholderiales bacterium]
MHPRPHAAAHRAAAVTLAVLALGASQAAQAHISYTGRNLGSFSGLAAGTTTLANQAATGNFGWADATDADYGDSHKSRAFRFSLANEAVVTITVASKADATPASLGGLLPGFSVYRGLVHLSPAPADYDFAAVTAAYLAASFPNGSGGTTQEGAWNALGDWKVGNDAGTTFADLTSLAFRGYAVDGSAANFGNAPGVVGDGTADGQVTGTFRLAAGDYSLFVGGADYAAQDLANPNVASAYGMRVTLAVAAVPEPETIALFAAGLAFVGAARARRARRT